MADENNGTTGKTRKKQHIKDNIKVAVRCRPLLGDKSLCEVVCNSRKSQLGVVMPRQRGRNGNKLYTFDKVYGPNTKQDQLFSHSIEPIISDVLCGYNCTVFAYGQTGSGKTFTMEGTGRFDGNTMNKKDIDDLDGIIPRAIKSIFYQLERDQIESTVIVSHLEIYNEILGDLLSDDDDMCNNDGNIHSHKKKKLIIYNDPKQGQHGVIVQGLEEIICESPEQIFDILAKSTQKRRTAATNLNQRSSRSHCIFTITIRIKTVINTEEIVKTGTLNLVDLAGSESIARSGAENSRAKEAGHINTSLLTLGRVISALVERRQHIPYRESKLTRLLQESLGGTNKTLLIATISSSSPLEQTLSTLDYALRAKNIQNKPQLNVSMTKEKYVKELQVLINNYKKQIDALRSEKGIILPPQQYAQMTKKMEDQSTEIEKMSALFEAEKNKLMEMNELFTQTNDALNNELKQKEALLQELNEISVHLKNMSLELKKHKFAVTEYQKNEKELLTQAENVKKSLKNTLNARDILYEKINKRQNIEDENAKTWNQKKSKLVSMINGVKNEMVRYNEDRNVQIEENINCIKSANENVRCMQSMMDSMNELNQKQIAQKMEKCNVLKNEFVENGVNKALDEWQKIHQSDFNEIGQKYMKMTENVIPNFVNDLSVKLELLQCQLNELNTNLNEMHKKQRQETKGFVKDLNVCMIAMNDQMNADYNEESQYMNAWKIKQENVMNECKKYAMSEMNKLFDQIAAKQTNSFHSQHGNFMNMLQQKHKNLNNAHINPLNEILSGYKEKNDRMSEEMDKNFENSMNKIHKNVQIVSSQTINDWNNQMNEGMNDLSTLIQKSHKNNNDLISSKIQKNIKDFNVQSNECYDELTQLNEKQNENICNVSKSLKTHKQCLSEYNEQIKTYQIESNKPYFDKLSANLDQIKSESENYAISKYVKSGETPLKKTVIYPLQFAKTESFDRLISQFNEDQIDKNESSASLSYISSLRSTRSSSPFFIKEEIEIDFTETELGFRMYAGENDKNCFIRHCHSDVRVTDNAQIVAIDGINVMDKSVGYIRTLLATEQRPISIKFKNQIVDDLSSEQKEENEQECVMNSSALSALSDSYCNITTKKRQRKKKREAGIQKPKVKKLNYATPNAKRHKRNTSSLSPIQAIVDENSMDVDTLCSDIE